MFLLAVLGQGCSGAPEVDQSGPAEKTGMTSQASQFANSCSGSWNLNQAWLSDWCLNNSGAYQYSSGWLGNCITNNNGNLQWQYHGAYDRSCSACEVSNAIGGSAPWLYCYCRTSGGSNIPTAINLNDEISNINGVLHCDNGGF
jgi:hypothetical protein